MAVIRAKNVSDYTFKVGDLPSDKLKVVRFSGSEGISELFRFSIDLASTDGEIDFHAVVSQPALLTIHGPKGKRFVNGIVSTFEQTENKGRWTGYRAELVPSIWILSHCYNCRIFQNQNIPDIIKKVLTDAGIASDQFRFSLKKTYPTRDYCVQYRESDLSFISRLMEQYGLFYFFEHESEKHVMVLGDDLAVHVPISDPSELNYLAITTASLGNQEVVYAFRYNREIRPGAVTLRDFNFTKPRLTLEAQAQAEGDEKREVYDYPGEYQVAEAGNDLAKVRLEEVQSTGEAGSGQSNYRHLIAGYRFTLRNSTRSNFNREYLLIGVFHNGSEPQALGAEAGGEGEATYENSFQCIPSDVPFRPPRITPRPVIQGPQTAIVVGPKGEEIYTDEYGRVKIQFHWDREGKQDEKSSCWVRVSQVWAGNGWGAMLIPRIGQEVIVEFLEGDPDQPIITGRVYNGENKPPYGLPGEKTKSTIKSNSSKGEEGFNEIRFEDKKGEEQIFIHAEKNQDIRVKNDLYEFVGRDAHLIIKEDQIEQIENDRNETIGRDINTEIARDHNLKVKGKEAIEIEGSHSFTVKGDVIEVFKGDHSKQTSGDAYIKASNIVIEAMSNITIKVGQSYIAIEAGGITIGTMGTLELDAKGQIKVKGLGGLTLESPATAELKGSMTTVKGDGMLTVQGGLVKIN